LVKTPALDVAARRWVRVYSDGAARGNPGPAGAGAVVLDAAGIALAEIGRYLGEQTNNVAEYEGLLLGLRHALAHGATDVEVLADSQLLIRQLAGVYRVKSPGLIPLFEEAKRLLKRFRNVELRHIPREMNGAADEMSNRAIDERMND
jgi:ribonuclease HI